MSKHLPALQNCSHLVPSLFPACTRVYAFTGRCTYVQRIGLRGLGVVPTIDIAHYEYHYLSSRACAENRAIAPLSARILSLCGRWELVPIWPKKEISRQSGRLGSYTITLQLSHGCRKQVNSGAPNVREALSILMGSASTRKYYCFQAYKIEKYRM